MTEVITFDRNTERLRSLWPNGMFPPDWLDLWREDFRHANQAFLADAMKAVKRQFSSHQPELKWFHEAMRDRLRQDAARAPAERTNPNQHLEAMRDEADRDHRMMLREVMAASPETISTVRDRFSRGVLACLTDGMKGNPAQWPRFTVGMVWADMQRLKGQVTVP